MGVQINGSEGNVIATKGTYSGNVTIGGTLTYEDVTNIDSVGIITARSGIEIGASPGVGASISVDGNAIFSGITTAETLKATTGIVTTLTANTVTSLGDVDIADKIVHTGDTDTAIRFSGADTITAETAGSARLRINSSGQIQIGGSTLINSDPLLTLGQSASTVGNQFHLVNDGSADLKQIFIAAGKSSRHVGVDVSTNNFFVGRDNVDSDLVIASDGDIGIGTITPQNNARLQVSTSNQVVAAFEGTGGSDPQIYLGDDMTTPTDNCIIIGYDKADNRGYLTVGGDGDTVFTVKNGGDIEIGVGNLKFGTSGKGIDFSAHGNASGVTSELLDDYEEGTYTITDASGEGITYTSNTTPRYVKIGQAVHVQYDVTTTFSGSPTANSRFNLPFNMGHDYGSGVVGWNTMNFQVLMHISSAGAYFMDNNSGNDGTSHLKNSQMSGKRFIGSFWYLAST